MDIGPGDAVEALRTGVHCKVVAGRIYYVREVDSSDSFCLICASWKCFGLKLIGVPDPTDPRCTSWSGCAFRPYRGPEIERERWAEFLRSPGPYVPALVSKGFWKSLIKFPEWSNA